ncbi:hypothetical protein FE392_00905 [Xenorhabdus sp. 12]|uniref:Transglutaminase-like domain-containing protein n=1 Tax=Xenorhabdus santafensis TaxID=2582833 RepID=A0ABU4S3W4_9GAMM|nr:hypothetical protein [Xenorhabdus sp. 12]MDX7985900.1 hypothetical protein [Xenorhabdus sp. 12]
MTLTRNIFLARKAINHVNIQLGIVSPNQLPTQTPEQRNEKSDRNYELQCRRGAIEQNLVGNRRSDDYWRKYILLTNIAAIELKLGNCGEKAMLAFSYLMTQGAKPIDLFDIVDTDNEEQNGHTIVVIGRVTGKDTKTTTWNYESVICDPWANQIYPCSLYGQKAPFVGKLILRYRYPPKTHWYNSCNLL